MKMTARSLSSRARRTLVRALSLAALASALVPLAAQAETLVVDDDKAQCPDAGYTSLTQAVEFAQSHDTIRICAGTYVVGPTTGALPQNGLKIEKSLNIVGAGASKVTIEPGGALESAPIDVRGNLGNIITVQNTAPGSTSNVDVNVQISGVTITDNGHLVNAGVAFHNAVGSVTSSQIGPFTGSPSPGSGWGVVASNGEAVTPFGAFERNVTVSGDLITGYGAGGVLIDGSDSSVNSATKAPYPVYFRSGVATTGAITNNVIKGAGSAETPSQVGVQVNAGARATISGNQITGNVGATAGTAKTPGTGVGVLLTDADDTTTLPGSTTSFYTTIGSNNLTGNGYGIFNGTPDFPPLHEIFVNGTTYTPTSAELPESLTNTAMSTATAPVTVNYDVPGVAVHGATPKVNWYGSASGPVVGGPSAGGIDGVSAATVPSPGKTDEDSVLYGTAAKTAYAAPAAPGAVADAPPSATWGTPTTGEALVAEESDELLALATDDFGVTSVHIVAGEEDLGTMSSAPYEKTWTPPASLIGQSVTVTATVTDESGQTSVATELVPVIAKPVPPIEEEKHEKLGEEPHVEPKTETVTPLVISTPSATGAAPVIAIPATFARSPLHSLDLTPSVTGSSAIVGVEYLLDDRSICKATAAPFACHYLPSGADVGTHTLKIIATDSSGQTTQVSQTISFARFALSALSLHVKHAGSTLKLTGTLKLPARVTGAEGCVKQTVHVTFVHGGHKSSGSAAVSAHCTFSVSLPRAAGVGTLTTRLSGNAVVAPAAHVAKLR